MNLDKGYILCFMPQALVVEAAGERSQLTAAESVTEFISAKAIGSLVVAYLSGFLLEKVGKSTVFITTACFPLIVTAAGVAMNDTSPPSGRTVGQQFQALSAFLNQRVIWGPMLYVLAYMSGPDYDDALFFYFTNYLGFSPSFMGTLRFTYGIAAILGIVLFRQVLTDVPYRQILLWSIIVALPIYLSPLLLVTRANLKIGISDELFVLSGGFLTEAVAEIQLLPLLVLTAAICPTGLEGSLYGVMMSIRNLGGAVSKALSSVSITALGITATTFDNLGLFICICGAFNLIPILMLKLIPKEVEIQRLKGVRSTFAALTLAADVGPLHQAHTHSPLIAGGRFVKSDDYGTVEGNEMVERRRSAVA